MPKDEIELRNVKKDEDISFVKTISKTISGAFVNTVSVPTYELPGNFGARVTEVMPTDLCNVYTDQRNNMFLGYSCDSRPSYVPQLMEQPD